MEKLLGSTIFYIIVRAVKYFIVTNLRKEVEKSGEYILT